MRRKEDRMEKEQEWEGEQKERMEKRKARMKKRNWIDPQFIGAKNRAQNEKLWGREGDEDRKRKTAEEKTDSKRRWMKPFPTDSSAPLNRWKINGLVYH